MNAQARYAVIGDPVEHSLSPRLFGLLFDQLNIPASYRAEQVRHEDLGNILRRVRQGEFQGLSVTAPHKVTIAKMLDALEPVALRTGAVNCIRAEGKKLIGHNTEMSGVIRSLHHHFDGYPTRKRVLILGAGGAARAAAVALSSLSSLEIVVAARSVNRAKEIIELVERGRAVHLDDDLRNECARAELIINATSVGLQSPNADPLPPTCPIRSGQVVMDLVYRPLDTALIKRAKTAGAKTIDGLWVLIFQGIFQLALWTGRDGDTDVAERLHATLAAEAR